MECSRGLQIGSFLRIIQPAGIPDPLSQEEIIEYFSVAAQIVEDYIFEEDVHYYIICPKDIL